MNQYRIDGGHGWSRTLWCYAKEAVELWQNAGKGARLYLIKDGNEEVLLRPVEVKPAPKPYVEPPAPQAEPEEMADTSDDETYNHPVRSWFATPSW